jgi:Kdo2-lipid IVA lauroyltransferase/acyltransferase
MARRRNVFVEWIVATTCVGFGSVTAHLPMSLCGAIGRFVGSLACCVVPRTRKVALANLDLAYGDTLTRAEKVRIARESVQNAAIVAAQLTHIRKLHGAFYDKHVRVVGLNHVDLEKGFIVFGCHIGNWEWIAPIMRRHTSETWEVVRPLDNPRLNTFIDGARRANGIVTLPKSGAGGDMAKVVRRGGFMGLLVDQSPRENGVPVTFFGHPCWGTVGAAMLAARTRAPLHPISVVRQPDGTYVLEIEPALDVVSTGSLRQDLVVNAQKCQDAVEAQIRKHPGQWLWMHRRWKARPRLEREWEARKKQ